MSVLGAVSVSTATVVKAAAVVGMAVSAIALLEPALGIIMYGPSLAHTAVPGLIGLAASIAGWEFADWADGALHVNRHKSAQEAELARLQSHHGQAL